ncbi:MAG: DUF1538 domain-containing protein [Kiritimatiellae bacterium]|nr:DUF1538 domain-containing protein [Kiritimatiellia bacterium]
MSRKPMESDEATSVAYNVRITPRLVLHILGPYFWEKFVEQVRGITPVTLFLLAFQFLVFRLLRIEQPLSIAIGMCCVAAGLMFFLSGLRLGVMPLGEDIGGSLPAKSRLGVILTVVLILCTVATFAEPAISTLKVLGAKISPQKTPLLFDYLNRRTGAVLWCVALGVGFGACNGILRLVKHWRLKMAVLPPVILAILLTVLAALDRNAFCLVGVAWDMGGMTTGTATAPLLLALGVGMAVALGRHNDPLAGFGIITLCSIWAVVFLLAMGLFHSWTGNFMSPEEAEAWLAANPAGEAAAGAANVLSLIGTNLVAAAQAIIPLCAILLAVQVVVLREPVRAIKQVLVGIAFALVGLFLFQIGLERGLNPLGDQVGRASVISFSGKEFADLVPGLAETGRYGAFWGRMVVMAFGFLAGYGGVMAEPALAALGLMVEDVTGGAFRKKLVIQAVAIGVGLGLLIGLAKILFGWSILWTLMPSYVLAALLTVLGDEKYVNIGWDSGGVASGDVTSPVLIALGLGAGTAVGASDCFSLIAMASVWPIIIVQALGICVSRAERASRREQENRGRQAAAN